MRGQNDADMYCTLLLEERNELRHAIASRLRAPVRHLILNVSLLLNAEEPLIKYLGPTAFDLLRRLRSRITFF